MQPKVCTIIVNWNNGTETIKCLSSLLQVDYPNQRIFVVDNASVDDSVEEIRAAFPLVEIVLSSRNRGFGGGVNLGIQAAQNHQCDYVFILNNDAIVDSGILKFLIEAIESELDVGIVTPKIYFYDDPNVIWGFGGVVNRHTGISSHVGWKVHDRGQFEETIECDYAIGCALLLPVQLIEQIGDFDETFFHSCEDVDLSLRVRDAGYRVLAVPQAKVWHKVSLATEGDLSPIHLYYLFRNRLLLIRKRGEIMRMLLFFPITVVVTAFWCAYYSLKTRESVVASAILKGVRDGIQSVDGKVDGDRAFLRNSSIRR